MNAHTPRCCLHCSVAFLHFAATMCSLSIVYPHVAVNNVEATVLLWQFYFACNNKIYFALHAEFWYFCPILPKFGFSRQFHKNLQYQISSKHVQLMERETEMTKWKVVFASMRTRLKTEIYLIKFIRILFYKQNRPFFFCDQASLSFVQTHYFN